MRANGPIFWVVYQMTIRGEASGSHAVCDQREWEEIERAHPGYHHLVLAGIANEGEAERLARTVSVKQKNKLIPKDLLTVTDDSDESSVTGDTSIPDFGLR